MMPYKNIGVEFTHHLSGQAMMGDGVHRIPCADFELNLAECMEAYGLVKGYQMCEKFFEDVMECKRSHMTTFRMERMKAVRLKKLAKSQWPWERRWSPAYPYDSYQSGSFVP